MAKRTFVLTEDNEITAYPTRKEAEAAADKCGDDCHGFDSVDSLEAVLASGPAARAVEIWNGLPGVEPVKGFKSKGQAASRIFKQLSSLGDGTQDGEGTPEPEAAATPVKAKKPKPSRKAVREQKPRKSPRKAKSAIEDLMRTERSPRKAKSGKKAAKKAGETGSKKAQVIEMISKKGGATLAAIMAETGWLRHGVRGFIATLRTKHGLPIESFKSELGDRTYRLSA